MSSHIPVWDSTHVQFDNDEINFDNPYEPWKNITKLTKTVTTSIKGIQETLYKENKNRKNLLKEEDIAQALAGRNILRLTHTIQISSNRQFLAITFQNKQIMETFCIEPLLVKGFNITFKKFHKKKTLLNISFLNIPAETPDEPLTEYLAQYADIVGTPYTYVKNTTESPTIPAPGYARSIDYNNTYRDTSTRCLAEQYYASTTTNQLTNPDKETIPKDRSIIDRGQQTTTRHRTKETPVTITTPIPKTKAKAKTNKNNNNRKQLQQL